MSDASLTEAMSTLRAVRRLRPDPLGCVLTTLLCQTEAEARVYDDIFGNTRGAP